MIAKRNKLFEISGCGLHLGLDPRDVRVPVVGGHAGVTILPLLSQVKKELNSSLNN